MAPPPLTTFCHYGELTTGGYIIGALQTAYYGITLIGAILLLAITNYVHDEIINEVKEDGEDHEPYEMFSKASVAVLSWIIAYRVLGLASSILAIVAVHKRKRNLLLPYLIYEPIAIAGLITFWVVSLDKDDSMTIIFLFLLYTSLNIYFWTIVYCLFVKFRNEQTADMQNSPTDISLQPTLVHQQIVYPPPAYPEPFVYPPDEPPPYSELDYLKA